MDELTKPTDGFVNWGEDPFFFAEAARGGPWLWRVGGSGFEGEPLGPVRHAHDDAGEYYYMYQGSAYVETGGEEFVLAEGQLGYVPPDAPHNFLGPSADRDVFFFCVIAPNFADNKWRVRDFRPGSESLRMAVATPFQSSELPGGDKLSAQALHLTPDDGVVEVSPAGFDVVYLVVDGSVDIRMTGGLNGTINAGTYLHLREGWDHEFMVSTPSKVLRFDCAFEAWRGTPSAEDVEADS
jgi:mannose-6-phosphate isomerase-like protein (cupin superfamily)